jgi:nucleotide-binding universal stress UspA family protein
MLNVCSGERIALKNVLYLTDFSKPSDAALPIAIAIAREFGGMVRALHIVLPDPYTYMTPEMAPSLNQGQEESARDQMQRMELRFGGVAHETIVMRANAVWPALEQTIEQQQPDVIVLGTHGRTGAPKCLLGSVSEEILRRSRVPVITIGPSAYLPHKDARFSRVLFATDFTSPSLGAAPYALSIAQENEAQLTLLHVLRPRTYRQNRSAGEFSVAEAIYHLHQLVPPDAELWCRPETLVEYGKPAAVILQVAKQSCADLIVLGVRDTRHLFVATHLETTTAHEVVAHASCPVLTVRSNPSY